MENEETGIPASPHSSRSHLLQPALRPETFGLAWHFACKKGGPPRAITHLPAVPWSGRRDSNPQPSPGNVLVFVQLVRSNLLACGSVHVISNPSTVYAALVERSTID